jgi:hypothetical protein
MMMSFMRVPSPILSIALSSKRDIGSLNLTVFLSIDHTFPLCAALTAPRISSAIAKAAARAAEAAAARASSVSRESPPGEFRHAAMIPLDEFTAQPRPSASKKPVRSSARAPWAP